MRSAVLKFDVHSVFAIRRPIYEIQRNSVYSFNIQILANAYVYTPSRFVSNKINLQGVKSRLLMLIYELVFNKKKNSPKLGPLLPSPSKIYLKTNIDRILQISHVLSQKSCFRLHQEEYSYDAAIIHFGTNDNLRSKHYDELSKLLNS